MLAWSFANVFCACDVTCSHDTIFATESQIICWFSVPTLSYNWKFTDLQAVGSSHGGSHSVDRRDESDDDDTYNESDADDDDDDDNVDDDASVEGNDEANPYLEDDVDGERPIEGDADDERAVEGYSWLVTMTVTSTKASNPYWLEDVVLTVGLFW